MSRYDYRATRLFVEVRPAAGAMVPLERDQTNYLVFAPLEHARLDYMVRAVELGVSRLQPALTRHTQPECINLTRMRANAIEVAE